MVKRKPRGRPAKTEARAKAIELLARGYSQRSVAQQLGVAAATVCNWNQDPEFTAAVAQQTEEIGQQTRAEFMDLRTEAVKCLRSQMRDGGAAGVRAAVEVLRVTGITNVPVIPPRINDLFRGKTIEVQFVHPSELPARSGDTPAPGGSGDHAANAAS